MHLSSLQMWDKLIDLIFPVHSASQTWVTEAFSSSSQPAHKQQPAPPSAGYRQALVLPTGEKEKNTHPAADIEQASGWVGFGALKSFSFLFLVMFLCSWFTPVSSTHSPPSPPEAQWWNKTGPLALCTLLLLGGTLWRSTGSSLRPRHYHSPRTHKHLKWTSTTAAAAHISSIFLNMLHVVATYSLYILHHPAYVNVAGWISTKRENQLWRKQKPWHWVFKIRTLIWNILWEILSAAVLLHANAIAVLWWCVPLPRVGLAIPAWSAFPLQPPFTTPLHSGGMFAAPTLHKFKTLSVRDKSCSSFAERDLKKTVRFKVLL